MSGLALVVPMPRLRWLRLTFFSGHRFGCGIHLTMLIVVIINRVCDIAMQSVWVWVGAEEGGAGMLPEVQAVRLERAKEGEVVRLVCLVMGHRWKVRQAVARPMICCVRCGKTEFAK